MRHLIVCVKYDSPEPTVGIPAPVLTPAFQASGRETRKKGWCTFSWLVRFCSREAGKFSLKLGAGIELKPDGSVSSAAADQQP